ARDADEQRLLRQRLRALRLGLVDVHPDLAREAAGEHEEDDQEEQHVDHVDQVDLRRAARAALEAELVEGAHAVASFPPPCLSPRGRVGEEEVYARRRAFAAATASGSMRSARACRRSCSRMSGRAITSAASVTISASAMPPV